MHECKTVTLRTRPLKKNMLSFYLDYYPGYRDKESMKVIRHESLGIYIYAEPKNQREQNFNAVMSEKAEAIRCRRFESIVNERYDFFDKSKMKGDFLAYYKKTLRKHDQKWEFVYLHFFNFVGGKCSFEEIDVDLCNKFREYLLNAKQLRRPERPISRNSAVGYWSTFRGFLKILYRNKLIHSNVNDFLEKNRAGRCGQRLSQRRRTVQIGRNTLQDTGTENRLVVLLPDKFENKRYSHIAVGRNR